MQCQKSNACAQKNIDKNNKIMEKLKLRILKIQILRNSFKKMFFNFFFKKIKVHFLKRLEKWSELDPNKSFTHGLIFFWKTHFETIQF